MAQTVSSSLTITYGVCHDWGRSHSCQSKKAEYCFLLSCRSSDAFLGYHGRGSSTSLSITGNKPENRMPFHSLPGPPNSGCLSYSSPCLVLGTNQCSHDSEDTFVQLTSRGGELGTSHSAHAVASLSLSIFSETSNRE